MALILYCFRDKAR